MEGIHRHHHAAVLLNMPTTSYMQVNNAWEAFTTSLQQFDTSLVDQKQQLGVAVSKQLEDFKWVHFGLSKIYLIYDWGAPEDCPKDSYPKFPSVKSLVMQPGNSNL